MKYYQQLDITDCGAACLAMIASHFGKSLNIAEIRSNAGTDIIGTNILGLITAAHKYGLKAQPVKGTQSAINKTLHTPFIVHMHVEREEGNWVDHYVVIKKITSNKIEIWDPDPLHKKKKISYEIFLNTGQAMQYSLNQMILSKKQKKKVTFY